MSDLLAYCRSHTDEMLDLLKSLIEYETFTVDKPSTDRLADHLVGELEALGAAVERFPLERVGDVLLAKWNADAPGKPITFITHMDTVWPVGTLAERPIRIENGRLYGPGSIDMKAGITVTLSAIKVLRDRGEFPQRPVWVLLTSDEEIGSIYSKDIIFKVAAQSGLCLVMEPATPEGALKTWRKGVSDFRVKVTGKASHAGGAPEQGINAVVELAHQIVKINALNALKNGTSTSVTMVKGGHTNNVIPDSAEAYVDVRFLSMLESERVKAAMAELYPVLPGAKLDITSGDYRPPMERNDLMVRTFEQTQRIGAGLGLKVDEGGSGGGSDGNFTASMGTPTLDGMGPTGEGLHAVHENVLISSVPDKVALVAAMIQQWEM